MIVVFATAATAPDGTPPADQIAKILADSLIAEN